MSPALFNNGKAVPRGAAFRLPERRLPARLLGQRRRLLIRRDMIIHFLLPVALNASR